MRSLGSSGQFDRSSRGCFLIIGVLCQFGRRSSEVPWTGDHSGRHDPSRSADNAFALILLLDHTELEIDKLAYVTDEGEDLADAIVDHRHGSEEVDYGVRDRFDRRKVVKGRVGKDEF